VQKGRGAKGPDLQEKSRKKSVYRGKNPVEGEDVSLSVQLRKDRLSLDNQGRGASLLLRKRSRSTIFSLFVGISRFGGGERREKSPEVRHPERVGEETFFFGKGERGGRVRAGGKNRAPQKQPPEKGIAALSRVTEKKWVARPQLPERLRKKEKKGRAETRPRRAEKRGKARLVRGKGKRGAA